VDGISCVGAIGVVDGISCVEEFIIRITLLSFNKIRIGLYICPMLLFVIKQVTIHFQFILNYT
jgi:hypothetical protein